MTKVKFLFPLSIIAIFLSGCWDAIDLEDRGFVIGMAIDLEDNQENEEQPIFSITNQMVVPSGLTNPSQGSGGAGESSNAFLNIVASGNSIYRVDEEVSTRSSKAPFHEHLMILVISEEVARTEHLFSELLDTFIRDVRMRRGMKVVVSKGEAKELLNFTTPEEQLPAIHIDELLQYSSSETGYLPAKRLGDIEEFHLRETSYVMPMLEPSEYIERNSGAVFHGTQDKMIGTLNQEEMQGLELVNSEATEKVIDFMYNDKIFAFEVSELRNKVKVNPTNMDQMKVTIDINLDGIIKESFSKIDLENADELKSVQHAVSEQVKKSIKNVIEKAQNELNTDVFNIWKILETKHHDVWKKVEDDWEKGENYFSNVTFDINVHTEIYSIGTSNKTN